MFRANCTGRDLATSACCQGRVGGGHEVFELELSFAQSGQLLLLVVATSSTHRLYCSFHCLKVVLQQLATIFKAPRYRRYALREGCLLVCPSFLSLFVPLLLLFLSDVGLRFSLFLKTLRTRQYQTPLGLALQQLVPSERQGLQRMHVLLASISELCPHIQRDPSTILFVGLQNIKDHTYLLGIFALRNCVDQRTDLVQRLQQPLGFLLCSSRLLLCSL